MPSSCSGLKAVSTSGTSPGVIDRLFDLSLDMLGTASVDGYFTLLNPAWTRTLGWSVEELMSRPFISFVHPDDVGATTRAAEHLATPGTDPVVGFENRYCTSDGTYRALAWNTVASDGVLYFVAHDVTVQRAEQERLRAQERELLEANDFLASVADNMAEGVYAVDHRGRVIYVNAAADAMLGWSEEELLGQLMHEITHFEQIDGNPCGLEACPFIGPRVTGDVIRVDRDVFIRCDGTRMWVSYSSSPLYKDDALGSVVVFHDISERVLEELRAERELDKVAWIAPIKDALAHDGFVLFAQPIVDLRTDEVVQHELLIRMKGSDGELILPGRFLPTAEDFGLITGIDRWVIEQSALFAAAGHKVEFNVSAKSIGLGLIASVADALRSTGAPPENLVCEITETAIMADPAAGEVFVRGLRDLGCRVALDDFGVGFGGLAYLKRLPVSCLKIDIQFVADLVKMETSRHVVRAIVDLARSFGVETVAEGAEDRETVELLKELGVDYVQGFFLGRPAPTDQIFTRTH